jgi:aminoglycoside 3-N-acetyltransferase
MTEADTIHHDYLPLTMDSLAEQLAACGLSAGQTVVVHSSMSKMGWIAGGEEALIRALLRVLTPTGTLMMPAHTTGNTDPSHWRHPPVPEHWWPIIREHMPAFDPATTPSRQLGRIAELFRTWPGVKRSSHPIGSFAALGPNADYLTCTHRLEGEFAEDSPLGNLYQLDGYVLLIGVGHDSNTSLHVAEQRAVWPGKRNEREGTAMYVNGVRQWVEYDSLIFNSDDFAQIGSAYEAQFNIPLGQVGRAEVHFMKQRPLVDFAVQWMETHRT